MRKSARGFTLIELLVVIAITAIIGVATLSNYRSFGEDKNLKNAVLDIQSLLRTAQTNVISSTQCNTQFSSAWQVEFLNSTTINLKCLESGTTYTKKTLQLNEKDPNLIMQAAISGIGTNCPTTPPFSVRFMSLNSNLDFLDPDGNKLSNCTAVTITLKNSKTLSMQTLTIEQGGRIYAP